MTSIRSYNSFYVCMYIKSTTLHSVTAPLEVAMEDGISGTDLES